MNAMKLRTLFKISCGLLLIGFLGALLYFSATLPSYQEVQKQALGSNRFFVDRQQEVLHELRVDHNKRRQLWVPLSSFSNSLKNTVIQIEDKHFTSHIGIDFLALGRALYSTLQGHRIQGASTISMQTSDLIDQSVLIDGQSIVKGKVLAKFRQIFRGLALDLVWSKSEILEAYLNLVHLRGEVQGIHSFSKLYLQKSPLFLNQAESVVIATLIQAPNRKPESLHKKACLLGKTADSYFSCQDIADIVTKIQQGPMPLDKPPQVALHLAQRLRNIEAQGNQIQTTLDFQLQTQVQKILEKNLSYLQARNVRDSAAVVIENKTGHVLAYVGTVKKFSKAYQVDGVNSPRQAGSTLKPFLYGRAIDKKILTSSSLIDDSETAIKWEGGLYRPSNYDNKFHGMVTVRQALASSLNVPAVKVVRMLGLSETYNVIENLKFPDFEKTRDTYGASLALGAAEIRLLDLANAYRALANGGQMTPVVLAQEPYYEYGTKADVLSKEAAFIIGDILSDSNARRIGFNWHSALETRMWSAVKTGTSKDLRDNWCVGYSSKYTVAVWAGNFDGSAMKGVSGVTGAGPSWNEIMHWVHRNQPTEAPQPPPTLITQEVRIEKQTGTMKEYFLPGTLPTQNNVLAGLGTKIKFEFPVDGSTLTLNPHKNQTSANISVRYSGDLPEDATLIFKGKKYNFKEGQLMVREIKPGQHQFRIVSGSGETLAQTRFKLL